jgi:hypothetical protein
MQLCRRSHGARQTLASSGVARSGDSLAIYGYADEGLRGEAVSGSEAQKQALIHFYYMDIDCDASLFTYMAGMLR